MGGFPLDTRVEIDLDGWKDVTSRVYARDPVSITRGRPADSSSTDPASCRFTLDNRDGAFSARNPHGPYFGKLRRNVPVRVSLPAGSRGLVIRPEDPANWNQARAYTPEAELPADVAVELDVRCEVDAESWSRGHLVSKYAAVDGDRSFVLHVSNGYLVLMWSPDGLAASREFIYATEAFPDAHLPARRAVRAHLVADTGGAWRVTFYTADTLAGPWVQLGDVRTGSAATSLVSGTAPVEVGACTGLTGNGLPGRFQGAEVRTGFAAATVLAAPDFSSQPVGALSFTDSVGCTWFVASDAEITDRDYRFHGEISQWPQTWAASGADRYVTVNAYGMRRRLTLNAPPLDSAMFREFTSPTRDRIVAYWPLEEAKGATSAASGIAGHPAMAANGGVRWAEYDSWPSSGPLPYMGSGELVGEVPHYADTGEIAVRFFIDADKAPAAVTNLLTLWTAKKMFDVDMDPDGQIRVRVHSENQEVLHQDSGFTTGWGLHRFGFMSIAFEIWHDGPDLWWQIIPIDFQSDQVWDQPIPTLSKLWGWFPGEAGRATRIALGLGNFLEDVALGHLAVADRITAYAATAGALNAWNGETAEERVTRLSTEDGITVRVVDRGLVDWDAYPNGHALGDQPSGTWLSLLEEVEFTDMGLLVESRDGFELGYRPRAALLGQAPRVTLDYNAGQISGTLQPVDDDEALINDITVKRSDGGSFRAVEAEGPLSVFPPPLGVGRYSDEVEVSAQNDRWLPNQAAFRLHVGTVDEARYPQLSVDVHSPRISDAQAALVRSLEIGDRIDIVNAEPWFPGSAVGQIVTGYTEDLQVTTHRFVFNLVPASPWEVATFDGPDARYDTAGAELYTAIGDDLSDPDPLGVALYSWGGAGVPDGPMTETTAGIGDARFDVVSNGAFTIVGGRVQADQAAGDAAQLIWNGATLGAGLSVFGVRAEVEFSGYPSANGRLIQAYDASTVLLWWLDITPEGTMRMKNPSGITVAESTVSVPLNQRLRVDVLAQDGPLSATVYAGETVVFELSSTGLGGVMAELRFLNPNQAPTWPRTWLDNMSVTDPNTQPPGGVQVATTLGPTWTTNQADMPFDVVCGGERMRVSAVSEPSTTLTGNPYFASNVDGWAPSGCALAWSAVVNPGAATGAMVLTPDGLATFGGAGSAYSPGGVVSGGARHSAFAWVRPPVTSSVRVHVNWLDGSGAFLGTTAGAWTEVAGMAWSLVAGTFTAPATAAFGAVWFWYEGAPAPSTTFTLWGVKLVSHDGPVQTFTVTRGVNGVQLPHAAGTPVELAERHYVTF